jgi:hypothetical protein
MAVKKKTAEQDVNLRRFILDALKPSLPKGWVYMPYGASLDTLSTTVVMLTLEQITRFDQAPQSHRNVSYTLTVLDPSTNFETREDSLDDSIIAVLDAIDGIENLSWSDAKRGINGQNLGYDITITIPIHKTNTEGA